MKYPVAGELGPIGALRQPPNFLRRTVPERRFALVKCGTCARLGAKNLARIALPVRVCPFDANGDL
jgi:hypothetical protein